MDLPSCPDMICANLPVPSVYMRRPLLSAGTAGWRSLEASTNIAIEKIMDRPSDLSSVNGSGFGQPVRRREDFRLVRGGGRYTADENLPGQVYAVMLRSPHAHARIRAIAADKAKTVAGVIAVFTGADCVAGGMKPIPHIPWSP